MGRVIPGGYAEYTVVPVSQVQLLKLATKISWNCVGCITKRRLGAHYSGFPTPGERSVADPGRLDIRGAGRRCHCEM